MTTKRSRIRGIFRPTRAVQLAAGALLVVAVAACQSNNIPEAYNDVTKASFIGTCTGSGVAAANGTTTSIASTPQCQCSYQVFVDQVPYNDDAVKRSEDAKDNRYTAYQAASYHPTYVQLDKDLKEDPNKITQLPEPVQAALKTCSTTKELVTPGSTPGTVVPGSTGGTTVGTTVGTALAANPGAGSTP